MCACVCVCVCVEGSNWVRSLLPAWECLNWALSLYGNHPRCCRTPPSPLCSLSPPSLPPSLPSLSPSLSPLPLSLLVCKRSIVWNIDGALRWGSLASPQAESAGAPLWGSDHGELPMPTPCSMLSRGACHVTVRHLHLSACVSSGHAHYHLLCYLWEPVRSPGGWQGVGEVFFLQHCSLYPALKKKRPDAAAERLLVAGLHKLFRRCCVFS